jgi:imidazolonepropionase-like amidohydrolase
VPFLAGSDAAVVFMHAGPSLHGELASLVRHLGFSPVEALRAATMEPARLFGLERELGLVRAGFIADLVLIDGDPLADITRTRAIVGVMTNGVYYGKSGIDALLERAARDAR